VTVTIFAQLYLSADTNERLAESIWRSQTARSVVSENIGPQDDKEGVRDNLVDPFFESDFGGFGGKLVFSLVFSFAFLAIAKLFIIVIRVLAGSFAWILTKSELV
jgi:hypothetical protein